MRLDPFVRLTNAEYLGRLDGRLKNALAKCAATDMVSIAVIRQIGSRGRVFTQRGDYPQAHAPGMYEK